MGLSDDDLDRLLARGGLGGPARERIFEKVAAAVTTEAPSRAPAVERRPAWSPRRWLLTLAVAAGGAAAALVLVVPPGERSGGDGWTARGAARPAVALDVACLEGTMQACPTGSTLVFSALGDAGAGYLTAHAQPRGGGTRIWYFSGQGDSPRLAPSAGGTRPATRGIRLGAEHQPGDYVVHIALSSGPSAPPLAEARFDLKVVAR